MDNNGSNIPKKLFGNVVQKRANCGSFVIHLNILSIDAETPFITSNVREWIIFFESYLTFSKLINRILNHIWFVLMQKIFWTKEEVVVFPWKHDDNWFGTSLHFKQKNLVCGRMKVRKNQFCLLWFAYTLLCKW